MSDQFGVYSEQYQNDYSKQQNEQFTAEFSAITQLFVNALDAGTAPDDEQVQAAVQEHYRFCAKFWQPDREAYKSLAMSYLLPSPYRDSYEGIASGLAKYHYDAIVIWADRNLS